MGPWTGGSCSRHTLLLVLLQCKLQVNILCRFLMLPLWRRVINEPPLMRSDLTDLGMPCPSFFLFFCGVVVCSLLRQGEGTRVSPTRCAVRLSHVHVCHATREHGTPCRTACPETHDWGTVPRSHCVTGPAPKYFARCAGSANNRTHYDNTGRLPMSGGGS